MSHLLPFVVAGLVAGSLYGLAATGLVLTWKTSGIFNFAHGAVGAAAAFLFYQLRDVGGLWWPLALVVSVGVAAPGLGLLLSLMSARLADASTVRRVVATVGVLLVIQGVIQLHFGVIARRFNTPLPRGSITVFTTVVGYDQLISIALAVAGVVALAAMFRSTRLGLEMRAVVDNPELLDLAGGVPRRVRAASWMIGAAFAGLSGVLFAPTVGLDSLLLTFLVIQAFGAVALGRFRSLGASFLGGLAIGVVQALLRAPDVVHHVPLVHRLSGLDQSVSFLALFAVLLLLRRGTFSEPAILRAPRLPSTLGRGIKIVVAVAGGAVVAILPHAYPAKTIVFIQGAVFVTIMASLFLLVDVSDQVSLCQVTFVAVGATAFAHFTTGMGLPWLVGVVLAALVAVPVGAVVAIPATRLSGVFLALATLGFGVVVQQMAYNRSFMFGGIGQQAGRRPSGYGLGSDSGYFYLCVAVAAAALLTVVVVRRTRLGRLLNAAADSPLAVVSHGSSVNVTKVLVFCLAASMAATGGALYVGVVNSVSSAGVSPAALIPFNSLLWLGALAVAGRNPVISPILAAAALVVVPSYVSSPHLPQYLSILFGASALIVAMYAEAAAGWVAAQAPAWARRGSASPVRARRLAVAGDTSG